MKIRYTISLVLFFALSVGGLARTWTNAEGKSIEANFVKLESGVVHLRKGGKVYKVPLEKLSNRDQEFVAEQTKPAKDGAEKEDAPAPAKPSVKLPFHLKHKVSGDDLKIEEIAGKPIVIHQWNAHCQACPPSLKAFEKLARRKRKLGATFLVLHYFDKIEMAKSKSESIGLKLPVYHGGGIKWDEKKFGKFVWPHVVLIDSAGSVVYMGAENSKFDKALKQLTRPQ